MDNQVENMVMKDKKGNKVTSVLIFLGICLISLLNFFMQMDFSDKYTISRSLGVLCGGVLGGSLFVFGITALICKISKKDKRKIILIVSSVYLISNFCMISNEINYRKEKRENEYAKIALADEKMSSLITSSASGNMIIKENITYEKYGEAEEALNLVQDFYSDIQEIVINFNNDVYELDANKILSYEVLGDSKKLLDARMEINRSIESINDYYDTLYNVYETYLEKIKTFSNSNDYSKNFAMGFNSTAEGTIQKSKNQRKILVNQYKSMDNILKFLELKNGEYRFYDEELVFLKDEDVDEYNELIDKYNDSVDLTA